ncbi:hypothetical protein A1O3_07153 [Capronia epimyces CBS 606.96]|uniref:Short-chain dehydrogenase n=1 Tax=Capronia epimyces CBS 606.96 TaxID=1182542 RepID=W9XK53_9EURO|nr:uncharacterized protein A1O3_07153 [Capronia epimyces CBS 606.96]EXJ80867.1 hypothetical protein A1O3_07153 [Capronia epimyces CBS 606.96]
MTSNPQFGRETTATEVARVFGDGVRGKTVVVVGVSPQSLGESLSLALAAQSPSLLVLVSRTRAKMQTVAKKVQAAYPEVRLSLVPVDLSCLQSVRDGAAVIDRLVDHIDMLINNAGVMIQTHTLTPAGLELHFATNHIGPFLLTNLLMPKMLQAARASAARGGRPGSTRIVNVSSQGHEISPIRFGDVNFHKPSRDIPAEERPASIPGFMSFDPPPGQTYSPFVAYAQSKTANILISLYLNRHLDQSGVKAIATHPGSIWTDLSRNLDANYTRLVRKSGGFWKDIDQGSATTLVAALDPKLGDGDSDDVIYLRDCQVAEPAAHATDLKAARRLWRLSEEIVGQTFSLHEVSRL